MQKKNSKWYFNGAKKEISGIIFVFFSCCALNVQICQFLFDTLINLVDYIKFYWLTGMVRKTEKNGTCRFQVV